MQRTPMTHFFLRHKVLTIFVLIIITLAVFTAFKWKTWFHNPEEEAYAVADKPEWIMLTFGNGMENSRYVSWICGDEAYESNLELVNENKGDTTVIEANGEIFESRAGKAAYYMVRLNDLDPDTHYNYRVSTNGRTSEWYGFQTYPYERDRFAFVYVGDVQDTINGVSNTIIKEAFSRNKDAEFLVCGGDLTERPTFQNWEETFRDLDSIRQHTPVINVTGNHEYLKGIICTLERRFPLVFSYFLDSKVDDNMVYTMNYGNAQFFLLDSNREFFYLWSQRSWLKEQLEQSKAKWKIVVLHHPLYSIKGNNLIQKWMFNGIIQDYGVDLVLQGHEHAYARRTMKNEDGTMTTPVYTISHCSPKNYLIEFDDEFDKFGISSRYYQTVRIKGDTMALATYEAYGHTLYDSLNIIKPADGKVRIEDLGKNIKEYMEYEVVEGSSKSRKFAERINDYKQRHPERMKK